MVASSYKGSRIAIFLPNLVGGGAERVCIDLAREFIRSGHRVEFLLLEARGELLLEAQSLGEIRSLECSRFRQVPVKLARYLSSESPDALLVAMWPLTGIAGFVARVTLAATRLVASEHVDFRQTPSLKNYERWMLRRFGARLYAPFERIIAVSSGVAESLQEVVGLSSTRLRVIHNPVRVFTQSSLADQDYEALAGWLDGKIRVIAIGSLKAQKGFDTLLRALAELRLRVDAELLILGEGGLRFELEELASKLGVSEHVWMPGFRDNPATFLQYANIFVLSSNWEGFGNVIVEALGEGVPVVSTDCKSGPAEILDFGRYGELVDPGDWQHMAAAVEATLCTPPDPALLKARAADFRPDLQAAQYLQHLVG